MQNLQKVAISGLFDRHDLELDLTIKPLFLVGPNGTGKSTALTIVHCILSAQWWRLTRLPFSSVCCVFDGTPFEYDKQDFEVLARLKSSILPVGISRKPPRLPDDFDVASRQFRRLINSDKFIGDHMEARYTEISLLFNYSENTIRDQVLYYPTYRRIERDLSELFEIDDEFGPPIDFDSGIKHRFESYGEVIGFGGQDIRTLLENATAKIENSARQILNEHSVKFLDVLNKSEKFLSDDRKRSISEPKKIERLADKINQFAPGAINTESLKGNLNSLREKINKGSAGRLKAREEITVYYVSELFNVLQQIDELSKPLTEFCTKVTSYLKPTKQAALNEKELSINIRHMDGTEVNLEGLSSGEKQVLSLFAFLMFSNQPRGRILILDEPELSLSVSWQKRLVHDILSTNRPDIFIAATHSPFIFERFSLTNVMSLGEL